MVTFRSNYMSVQPGDTARDRWRDFDLILFVTMLVLMAFGVLAIWSAVGLPPVTTLNNGTFQAALGVMGLVLMFLTASLDYRFLNTLAWPLYGLGILSLLAVPFIGVELGGAKNWIDFGFFLVQPAEIVRVTTLIAMASFIASRGDEMRSLANFVFAAAIVAFPAGIILIGPDLGMTMVYMALWASTLLVMHTRALYIALSLLAMPVIGFIAWEFIFADYQKVRFIVSFTPEIAPLAEGFQILQARISIGAGGLWGEGLRGGTQSQLNLLSVRDSDFIFAHASGMFGFVGMLGLFLALVILLWRCLKVTEIARDHFGQILAVGIAGVLFFQAFLNIGMNVGLMPVTGITLPFVSYGLSSLWSNLIMVGILQSIRMHHRKLAFVRQ
jgi:rod shape determining protein RodA